MKPRPIISPRLKRRARIIRAIQAVIMLLIVSFAFWLAVLPSAHAIEPEQCPDEGMICQNEDTTP